MASGDCCELAAYKIPHSDLKDDVKQQIGQTLIASFEGTVHSVRTQTLLKDYAVGNFLLNTENLYDEPQILRLVLALQESARALRHPAPLLIGIEQEGGLMREGMEESSQPNISSYSVHDSLLALLNKVVIDNTKAFDEGELGRAILTTYDLSVFIMDPSTSRRSTNHFSNGIQATQFPSPLGLAASQSTTMTHDVGQAIGKELVAVGINWNVAPVIDILTDLTEPLDASRVSSDNPAAAVGHTSAFIRGLHDVGITTSVTEALSMTLRETYRRTIAGETLDEEILENDEVQHLRVLFENQVVDSVMLSSSIHGFNDTVQAKDSIKFVIDNVLRELFSFQGPIISNCSSFPLENGACLTHEPLRALLYGSDMVRLPKDYDVQIASINAIYAAIESPLLALPIVTTCSNRITDLKTRFSSWSTALNLPVPGLLSSLKSTHEAFAQATYRATITTFQSSPSPLLLFPAASVLLLLAPTVPPMGTRAQISDPFEPLGRTIARLHPRTRHVPYSLSTGLTTTHIAFLQRASAVVMVLACTSSALAEAQSEFWKAVESVLTDCDEQNNSRVVRVVVGAGDVRDLTQGGILDHGWWGIECWEYTKPAVEAVAEVLIGEREASGSLPISRRR